MDIHTIFRRGVRAAFIVAASSLAPPALASPEVGLSFSPGGIRVTETSTLSIALQTTTPPLAGGAATIAFPGLASTGVVSSNCLDNPATVASSPAGSSSVTISPVDLRTSAPCNVTVQVSPASAGTITVTALPGSFVDPSSGPSPGIATASLCVTAPIVVTSPADTAAPTPIPGSFRAALVAANGSCAGPIDITFAMTTIPAPPGGRMILVPMVQMPPLTASQVTIDGYTQPGASPNGAGAASNSASIKVELDGTLCVFCSGLVLQAPATVRGLAIHSFQSGHGIDVQSSGVQLYGNYIGANALGAGKPNGLSGIHVGAAGTATIGTPAPADANLIAANPVGIWIEASADIAGNQVGGLPSGAAGNGNGVGIRVTGQASIERNVVRYSSGAGIAIARGGHGITTANSSFANGGPGIDANEDGPTPNDETGPPYDTDGVLNYPVVTSVEHVGGNTIVQGYLKTYAGPLPAYDAELYANSALRGVPEGERLLGTFAIVPDATGFAAFSQTIAGLHGHISMAAISCGAHCLASSEYSFASAAVLALSPPAVTFADRAVGTTSAPLDVTISNAGNEPMTISSIAATGDFSLASSCPPSLAAGDTCVASVAFTPLVPGPRSGALTVAADAAPGTRTVPLAGNGLASIGRGILDASPGLLEFDGVPIGSASAPQLVTLSNSGVAAIHLVVRTVGDFSRTSAPAGATDCGATLAPHDACEIAVVFAPSMVGALYGELVVDSDASNPRVEIALFGTSAQQPPPGPALVVPDHVTFGDTPVGVRSPAATALLTNATRQPLAITGLAITGDFAVGDSCTTIAAGGSCSVTLFFTPSARGARMGDLAIRVAGEPDAFRVALSGTGVANPVPALAVSPTRVGFGNTVVGPPSPGVRVTLRNPGELPVTLGAITVGGDFLVTGDCGPVLAAAATCSLQVAFYPRIPGDRASTLAIASDAEGSPHHVSLSGTGCALPSWSRSRALAPICTTQ